MPPENEADRIAFARSAGFNEGREKTASKATGIYVGVLALLSLLGMLTVGAFASAIEWGGISNWGYAFIGLLMWLGVAWVGWVLIRAA